MDRFESREDIEFNQYAFGRGVEARKNGFAIDSHPSFMRGWDATSFRAGWSDEDARLRSQREIEEAQNAD